MALARPFARKSSNGFTLLELLISLTILAIVIVIVFGALRIGSRAWEKGEQDLENQQRMRVVFDLIKHQISSASAMKEITAEDGKAFFMKGDSTSLEFLSYVPVFPGDAGLVHVKYQVLENEEKGGDRLIFFEKGIVFSDKELENNGIDEDKNFHVLIPVAPDIRFEYLNLGDQSENPQWVEQWDKTEGNELPLAVRLSAKYGKNGSVLTVIAPIGQVTESQKGP